MIGTLGKALIRGVQSEYVLACIKHYAFNSMENSRFQVSIDCDKRTEREVFLAHFKDCVDEGAAAVMTAFNQYQGNYCGHSQYLLRRILKKEWGFDGIVISDFFWGIKDTVKAAKAGVDVEMCHTYCYGKKLIRAVQTGRVKEEMIDDAALRITRTLVSFEKEYEKSGKNYGEEIIGCKAHAKLALRAAQEGITLIKNERQVLPLSKKLKKVAIIGSLAAEMNLGDEGSSRVFPGHVVTLLEGIIGSVGETEVVYYRGENLEHVIELAAESDAIIFTVGLNYLDEGEYNPMKEINIYRDGGRTRGGDRKSLSLHAEDIELLNVAGGINPASVVVLIGGGTILISDWEEKIPAILYAYYPGQEGGTALGQILFGDISPSGKLPFVIPEKETDLPEINWKSKRQWYGYYHGYTYLEKNGIRPYRPFGFGMSYTSFRLEDARFNVRSKGVAAQVSVKNIGDMPGAEVVQMYAGFSNSTIERPVKVLCGFQRVHLYPGETKRVEVFCPEEKLKFYNEKTEEFELEHMEYEFYIGTSSDEKDLCPGSLIL